MKKKNRNTKNQNGTNNKNIIIRIIKKEENEDGDENEQNSKNQELKNKVLDPIEFFLEDINKTQKLVQILLQFMNINLKEGFKTIDEIKKENKKDENENRISLKVDKKTKDNFDIAWEKVSILNGGQDKVLESFLIYTITLYENFLSAQIKLIFKNFPGKLSNDKELSYEEFTKYSNIEDIQNYYIESCIRTIIGGGASKQIKQIEKLIDKKDFLNKIIPIKELVEIGGRRNLYVHNEGKIDDQYIKNCEKNGGKGEKGIGEYLEMDKEYFNKVFDIIYQTTLIIGYLTACKCYNTLSDLQQIDDFFNHCCVSLIDEDDSETLDLPVKLLEFVSNYTKQETQHTELQQIYFIINQALCYKIKGEKEKCNKLLDKRDWSATNISMQFAKNILKEEREMALKKMQNVSIVNREKEKDDETKHFTKNTFKKWPLFFEFRKVEGFKEKYKEIFNEEFSEDQENI